MTGADELLSAAGNHPDTELIARRVAGNLAGVPLPAWEYITVDVSVPQTSVPLFQGWQLSNLDRADDPTLPISYQIIDYGEMSSPESLYSQGFGALRRPKPARTLDQTTTGSHDLLWPLLTLNLLDVAAIRAFTTYLVEPGRRTLTSTINSRGVVPAEVARWHPQPLALLPGKPAAMPSDTAVKLQAFTAEIGSHLATLSDNDRRLLGRAAEHHMQLAYHQGPGNPTLDDSYVAFRRVLTIEALLAGMDSDHDSIGRKVSQRAAVLVGHDDDSRVTVRELVKAAYHARSTFAHGSGRPKPVDLPRLARMTKIVIRRWLILASLHGARQLAFQLDDALLSTAARDGLLRTIAEHEIQAGVQ